MGKLTGNHTKDAPVRMRFLQFRKYCRWYGTFRTGNAAYFDPGVCYHGYNPESCYARRCPALKEIKNGRTRGV